MSTLQATSHAASKIAELVEQQGEKSISIIMPTYKEGRQVKQNAIRFKNLLSRVVRELEVQGESETQAETRVQLLFDLTLDDHFWQHQSAGVAIFMAHGQVTAVELHDAPAEHATVSEHFYLTPVALDAAGKKNYRVLALTWEEAKLYTATRSEVEPEKNAQFPVALSDVVLPPDAEEQLQVRTQSHSDGGTMFHGQGEGEQMIQSDRRRFLSEVGKRMNSLHEQPPLSLILVGTDEVLGEFKSVTKVKASQTVAASPDGLSSQELTNRILSVVNGKDSADAHQQLTERLGTALADHRASRDLVEIVEVATTGRIQTLLVNTRLATEGQQPEVDVCQLVNSAVIRTIQNGGEIVAVTDDVLDTDLIAAIYRY